MPGGNKLAKTLKKTFEISRTDIREIIRAFHSEMQKGLSGKKSSLKMIPEYVTRPSGKEKGDFIALDLGGTYFRVLAVKLKGRGKDSRGMSEKFTLKQNCINRTEKELFGFMADCIKKFMKKHRLNAEKPYNIGFTFSFPIKKRNIASGILIRWTKGFKTRGVEGKDVVALLNKSLRGKGLRRVKVAALANDTVSTLVAAAYEDPYCDIGVILGTGTNACYCEKVSNIKKLKNRNIFSREMVVNTEWGNFNKVKRTCYDRKLDRGTSNRGEQILEKMISGKYLGELARLILVDTMEKTYSAAFGRPGSYTTEYMSIVERDKSRNLSKVNDLLRRHGIFNSKYRDRQKLKLICNTVSTRAARLSAVALASVLTKMDQHLNRKHTIAVEGSVYEKHPYFSKVLRATLKEIFGKRAKNIKLALTKDASCKGAAILAATVTLQ